MPKDSAEPTGQCKCSAFLFCFRSCPPLPPQKCSTSCTRRVIPVARSTKKYTRLIQKSACQDDQGYSSYCATAGNNGISVDGGFREYALVDARQVAPLPSAIAPVDAAPLMCAGVTIYGALRRCQPELGPRGSVGIVGCGGGLGHLGLQFASKMGYRVVGIDNTDAALALSRSLDLGAGAAQVDVFDAREVDAQQVVEKVSQGSQGDPDKPKIVGLDAVIILPEAQAAFDYGMKLLRNHGKCVVVSFPENGFHISARDLVFRDISVVGCLIGSNKLLREMLGFAAVHDVKAKVKTFPLARLNDLVEAYHRGEGGKLVVDLSLKE